MTGTFGGGTPYKDQLTQLAQEQQLQGETQFGQGRQLLAPILGGPLPPEFQADVDAALQAARAGTKGTFANLGLGGSTMESSALSQDQQQSEILKGKLAEMLARIGTSLEAGGGTELSSSTSTYGTLARDQIANDAALMQAITGFGKAMGGGVGGTSGGGGSASTGGIGDLLGALLSGLGVDIVGA